MQAAAWVIPAYLLGCIPTGVLVARAYGVDIRAHGSGNIGATNALRVLGKKAGVLTLAGDMLKGVAAAFVAMKLGGREAALFAGCGVVIGHDFPVFMRFRGGKGVATSFGALLVLEPLIGLIAISAWLVAAAASKFASLGSLVSFLLLPVLAVLMRCGDRGFLILTAVLCALAYVRHAANIKRLISGEEKRIGEKAS